MTDRRRAIALVAFASAVQLTIGAVTPLDPDETYYWDWSRHLAAGYFDHPPVVAFVIKLGVLFFGATSIGVRIGSVLANCGAALLLVEIARRHAGERAAWRTACIVSAIPILTGWLLMAMPDPACYLFAAATLFAVDHALSSEPRSRVALRWWLVAGVAIGLAMASKYVAVLIPLAILIAFVSHPQLRRRFAEPGPWVACLVAAVVFSPVIIWNAQHDWVSFKFQLNHGFGSSGGSATDRVLGYIGGQAAFVTPILFVMMTIAVVRAWRDTGDGRRRVLAVVAAFSFLWFLISSFRQPVEANWPLLAYPAGAIALAITPGGRTWNRWLNGGIILGAAFVILIYTQMLVRIIPFQTDNDPVRRGHGWNEVAARVDAAAQGASGHTWVAANRYQDASELAFYSSVHPDVMSLNIQGRPNQYDLWQTFAERAKPCDNAVLLLDEADSLTARTFGKNFSEVHQGERIAPGGELPLMPVKRIWVMRCWTKR